MVCCHPAVKLKVLVENSYCPRQEKWMLIFVPEEYQYDVGFA